MRFGWNHITIIGTEETKHIFRQIGEWSQSFMIFIPVIKTISHFASRL